MKAAWTLVFSGRVQGVGFRMTSRALAREHPIAGWVRNREDGTVQMYVEGRPEDLERYLGALQGVMGRKIENTQVESGEPTGRMQGFEIRR